MATNQSRKISVFCRPIYFDALPFRNGLQYRNSDFKRLDRMNFSTLCTILVSVSPATSEFTLLAVAPLAAIQKNLHITLNISECSGPVLTYFKVW